MPKPAASAAARSALTSFLVCALLTLVLYLLMYFGAVGVADASNDRSLIEHGRWVAKGAATSLLIIFAVYWALSALLGRGPVGRSASANVLLALGVAVHAALFLNSYVGWAGTVCDARPYPHEGFQLARIYECPSSSIFFTALANHALFLLICSLAVRIVTSRKRAASSE